MKNLLLLNFRRAVRGKMLYILTLVTVVLILLTAVIYKLMNIMNVPAEDALTSLISNTFSGVNSLDKIVANGMTVTLAGVFAALFICESFGQKTVRVYYSRGYSRSDFFLSSLISAFVICFVMYMIDLAASFAFYSIFFKVGSAKLLKVVSVVGVQFFASLANISVYVFVCFAFKKIGAALAMIIAVPSVLELILTLLAVIFNDSDIVFSRFWVGTLINELSFSSSSRDLLIGTLISAVYMAIFVPLGYLCCKKSEV